jgi:5'(3')-deoxyribonucleotidase
MKKYKTIFLDQDGILAAFTTSVIKQLNSVTGDTVTLEDVVGNCDWNLEKMWGMTQKEWWQSIDRNPNFWLEIEPFPWAKKLYENLKYFADEVIILTAPSLSEHCIPHKIRWLQKHLGVPRKDIIPAHKKYLFARSDTLLIDDAKHNCDPFIENGGNAVLIPSDWNTLDLNYEIVWSKIVKCL